MFTWCIFYRWSISVLLARALSLVQTQMRWVSSLSPTIKPHIVKWTKHSSSVCLIALFLMSSKATTTQATTTVQGATTTVSSLNQLILALLQQLLAAQNWKLKCFWKSINEWTDINTFWSAFYISLRVYDCLSFSLFKLKSWGLNQCSLSFNYQQSFI